jgi:predicted AlkP superfamily pyrophosphatase or phosphodiesterase
MSRRAVFVCCDGLGRDWVTPSLTPILSEIAGRSLWCAEHRAVFPSVTRTSAASVTTGCHPGRHSLHGNRMGLITDGKIMVRDVGQPDFRAHMRAATGATLRVPALAERVANTGGFVAFSNVSPGGAYFLDPDSFGFVYHSAGSFGPGGKPIGGADALNVTRDGAGDWAMTERFCAEVLRDRRPCVSILWLANPDHTLHATPLGSPAHYEALAGTMRCVEAVIETIERLRKQGEDILLLIGSDHGQETIHGAVSIEDWLEANGLAQELAGGEVAVAAQGTAALFYAIPDARDRLCEALLALGDEDCADEIALEDGLIQRGLTPSGGLVAGLNMGRVSEQNPYGVSGARWIAADPGNPKPIGCGQHGGWGFDETRPFLLLNGPGVPPGVLTDTSNLVDIAPTMLAFLGLPHIGTDGKPLTDF